MEKSISIYLFVIYLTVLSEEANNHLLVRRTPPPPIFYGLQYNGHKHILVLYTCVFSVACVVPYNLLQSLALCKIL